MFRKPVFLIFALFFLGAAVSVGVAQQFGRRGTMQGSRLCAMQQGGRGAGAGSGQCMMQLDLANKTTLEGDVESVSIEAGKGMPSFVMPFADRKVTIVVSPYWALANANLEIRAKDHVSVQAFPSLQFPDTYVAAQLTNVTSEKSVDLRDDNGIPIGGRGPRR